MKEAPRNHGNKLVKEDGGRLRTHISMLSEDDVYVLSPNHKMWDEHASLMMNDFG